MALRTKIYNKFAPVSKNSEKLNRFQEVADTSSLIFLEKAKKSTGGKVELRDIADALKEFTTLFKAGIASKAEILTLARAFPNAPEYTEAASQIPDEIVMVVGGPASVSLIDREGHMITTDALGKAFKKSIFESILILYPSSAVKGDFTTSHNSSKLSIESFFPGSPKL